tara:strand:+ start:367 stop:594 length:228 start_codon:yes stop_codon:yes gene_type:complete
MFEIEMPKKPEASCCENFQNVLLCKDVEKDEKYKRQIEVLEELIEYAPTKDELTTHDGIVYFPDELMPKDMMLTD